MSILKNALKKLNKKEDKIENKSSILPKSPFMPFRMLIAKYFLDVAYYDGELSQEIYDKMKDQQKFLIENKEEYPYLVNEYEKALKIIENYRNWEAEKLGWK